MTVLDRILGYALRGPTCTDASVPSHAVVSYTRVRSSNEISPAAPHAPGCSCRYVLGPSPRLSKDLGAPFLQPALWPRVSMPFAFRDGTDSQYATHVNTIDTHCAREPAWSSTPKASSRRIRTGETLYNNIGILEPVVLQNATRFTGSKHATVATQTHPRRHSSATRGARCRSARLPAACRRVAARVVGVRAACELRFACTRQTWRLGEVLSVESVFIEYTLHRANLTGRAGWYRRAGGEAVRHGCSRSGCP